MSLRAFHLVFIAISIILAAFCAAWAMGQYRTAHSVEFAAMAAGAMVSAVGLAMYGAAFQRRTRAL